MRGNFSIMPKNKPQKNENNSIERQLNTVSFILMIVIIRLTGGGMLNGALIGVMIYGAIALGFMLAKKLIKKKNFKNSKLVNFIAWSNLAVVIIPPVLGLFLSATTFGFHEKLKNDKKYLYLGLFGFVVASINWIYGSWEYMENLKLLN